MKDLLVSSLYVIRDRWVTSDRWAEHCDEHRVRQGQDHGVLEGLRQARNDVRALLAELDELRAGVARIAGYAQLAATGAEASYGHAAEVVARIGRTTAIGLRNLLNGEQGRGA